MNPLSWLWSGLVWVDKAANWSLGWTLGGGLQPWGWTISDRLYLLRDLDKTVGKIGCSLLSLADKNHCRKAISNNPKDELAAEQADSNPESNS